MLIPFICVGIGIILGILVKHQGFIKLADKVFAVALLFLMLSIGIGIGLNQDVIKNIGKIGFNCVVITFLAMGFSIVFTFICEKTVLPLKEIDSKLQKEHIDLYSTDMEVDLKDETDEKKGDNLVWLMPVSLILGIVMGIIFRSTFSPEIIDKVFSMSLTTLYVCVGISQGANRDVFKYVRALGFKILWLPIATIVGSIVGGLIAGILLDLPYTTTVISSGGMSFYSLTGAFMTSTYGIEVGAYGFIVNIMREIFTIVMVPLLVKISIGSPIACGGAGNMDTTLSPVTKFVGVNLGLVTLITGTILTFVVPLLLPLLSTLL